MFLMFPKVLCSQKKKSFIAQIDKEGKGFKSAFNLSGRKEKLHFKRIFPLIDKQAKPFVRTHLKARFTCMDNVIDLISSVIFNFVASTPIHCSLSYAIIQLKKLLLIVHKLLHHQITSSFLKTI